MSIFIKITNGIAESIHYKPFDSQLGLDKTKEQLLQEGILVETIPEPEQIGDKVPILKYNGTSLYYEYQDAPIDEMMALKKQVAEQEQAIMELTALLSGGGANV